MIIFESISHIARFKFLDINIIYKIESAKFTLNSYNVAQY